MKAKRRTNKSRSKKHYNRTQKRSNKMNRKTYRRTNKRTKRINRRTRRTRRNNRKKGGLGGFLRRVWRARGAADQEEIERFCLWSAEYVPENLRIRGHIPGEYGHLLDYFKTFGRPLSELPELVRQSEQGMGASDRWHELFQINVERFLANQRNGTNDRVLRFQDFYER